MEKQGVPIYKHLGGRTATPEPVGSEGGGGWSPRNLVCSRRHLGNQDTLAEGGWFWGLGPLGQREEAAGTRTHCVGVVNLCPVHTPHFPFPHLGAWPARHSRYAQSESWAGPGLSCEERTFQEAASGTQRPERGPAGTRLSRPAPPPRRTSGGGMGGGDVMSSICLTCPSFLPPPICFPSLQSCHLRWEGGLWRWAGPLFQGTLDFQRFWKEWLFMGGRALPPSA